MLVRQMWSDVEKRIDMMEIKILRFLAEYVYVWVLIWFEK
jgi:hypothetical protein